MTLRLLVSVSHLCRSRANDLWALKDDPSTIWCPGTTREDLDNVLTRWLGGDAPLRNHVRQVMEVAEKNGHLVFRKVSPESDGFREQFSQVLTVLGNLLGRELPNWEGTQYYNASWNIPTMRDYFEAYAPEVRVCDSVG